MNLLHGLRYDMDRAGLNPQELAPILYAVSLMFTPDSESKEILDRMEELRADYESGTIGADWMQETKSLLEQARDVLEDRYKNKEVGASHFQIQYSAHVEHARQAYDFSGVEIGVSERVSRQIQDDIEAAHTLEDMKAIVDAAKAAHPSYTAGTDGGHLKRAEDEITRLMQDPATAMSVTDAQGVTHTAHVADKHDMFVIKESLKSFCRVLEDPRNLPGNAERGKAMSQSYGGRYAAEKKNHQPSRDAAVVSDHIGQLQEKIESVRDIQSKMHAEDRGHHKDSPEYAAMEAKVNAICEMTKNGFDPDDRAAVEKIDQAMKELYAVSKDYAEKKALKTKASTRGIERKNTALALLDIADPERAQKEVFGHVKDLRGSDRKKAVSLKELLSSERKDNRERQRVSGTPERRRVRKRGAVGEKASDSHVPGYPKR
ncbi:MAG: hypothetical protein K6B72_00585 [Lachnospiraceae bacterium]|nr:hypothetical protein [Lachnospiraceae bacterium]